jgi:Peptidase C13 family
MRNILIVLLAFAAGVLLMLVLPGHRGLSGLGETNPAHPAAPSSAAQPASASSVAGTDGEDSDAGTDDWPAQGPTPEQVLYAQPRMLHDALARLGPRVAGKPNLYLVAFAGDGGEDVFRNEAEYAAQLFTTRFGPSAHALILENHPDTLEKQPLASLSNLEGALDGLSTAMKPEDILLLYVSSHGSEDHDLLVDLDPLPLDQIGPEDLTNALARHPFKWKVLVVNACYSGGFVPALHGDGTLVLTAARTDRSSFGCGSDSDITYFGKAWLVDALNSTNDPIAAFKLASGEISQWETQDKLTPSEPQIDVGSGIAEQLALWRKGASAGPRVPFVPASPASTSSTAQ